MGRNQDLLDQATAAITAATSVEASATALIKAQAAAAVEAAIGQASKDAVTAAMAPFLAATSDLSAAVVAGTPVADVPPDATPDDTTVTVTPTP